MLLNNEFGLPTTRQKRGAGLLKAAEDRSGQSASELSRMRTFTHLFKSFDEFVQKHGTINWTEVKALLPKLKGGDAPEQKGKARPGKNAKRTVTRCRDCLDTLTKRLQPVEANDLPQEQEQQWRDSLVAFAEVISVRIGIAVTVGGVREESGSEEVNVAVAAG